MFASFFRQHPHKLATKAAKQSNGGEVWRSVNVEQSKVIEFKDLSIVYQKKLDIRKSLEKRRQQHIDPTKGNIHFNSLNRSIFHLSHLYFFKGGWDHLARPNTIDLHCVRLCYEALLSKTGSYSENRNDWLSLGHVLSKPIFDRKCNLLKIIEISSQKAPVTGGKNIILLCDKVRREDITVVFVEEDENGKQIWRQEIQDRYSKAMKVHHQYAIAFKSPKIDRLEIVDLRRTYVYLYRPSDSVFSDPIPFEFTQVPQSMFMIK